MQSRVSELAPIYIDIPYRGLGARLF